MQKTLITVCLAALLSACANFEFPGVYKIDIPQGNVIEQDTVDQLKIGMTEEQVRYLMGTPLVTDTFNPNRWDYIHTLKKGSGEFKRQRLTLQFESRLLASIDSQETELNN